jgi:hypothetical protein
MSKKAALLLGIIPDRDKIFTDPHLDFVHVADIHFTSDSNCLVSERYSTPPGKNETINVVTSTTLHCEIAEALTAYLDIRSESPEKNSLLLSFFLTLNSCPLPLLPLFFADENFHELADLNSSEDELLDDLDEDDEQQNQGEDDFLFSVWRSTGVAQKSSAVKGSGGGHYSLKDANDSLSSFSSTSPTSSFSSSNPATSLSSIDGNLSKSAKYQTHMLQRVTVLKQSKTDIINSIRGSPYDVTIAYLKKMPRGMKDRELVFRYMIIKKANGEVIIAFEDVNEAVDFSLLSKGTGSIRASTTGIYKIAPISSSQCRVTIFQKFDAGGIIGAWFLNLTITIALSVLSNARNKFQRNDEVDIEAMESIADAMKLEQQYSGEENNAVEQGTTAISQLPSLTGANLKQLESLDLMVTMAVGQKADDGDELFGKAEVVVDASIEKVASFLFHVDSRRSTMINQGQKFKVTKGSAER